MSLIALGSAQAQTKLKWAHVYETSEPYHTAAVWAAGEIAKRTNNRYTVEVFPASTLGKETDINQGLTLGTVDIIYTGQLFAGRTYGPIAIGGAPFMFRDFNHWKAFPTSPLFDELAEGYRQKSGGNKVVGDHLLRRASRHVEQGDQQARGHEGAEDPRARCAAVHDVPARGGRQPDADRVRRGLSGAAERHRRRAGKSAADDRREEVLRGAEVHRADRPHHRRAADDRQRPARGTSYRTPTRRRSMRC